MIEEFQEPNDGGVGLIKNPPQDSSDNTILFSAVAVRLGMKDLQWFEDKVLGPRTIESGAYFRRLNEPGVFSAHDDHWAAACVSPFAAKCIYAYGSDHWWCWGDWRQLCHHFSRFVWFNPLVKACKGSDLSWLDKKRLGLGFWWNFYGPVKVDEKWYIGDPIGETSGRQLLWLALPFTEGVWGVTQWRVNMVSLYGVNWLYELFLRYYKQDHEFTQFLKPSP
jgi:hypothetical protein